MAPRTVGLVWAVLETLAVAIGDEAGAATVLAVMADAAADERTALAAALLALLEVLALLVVPPPHAANRATAQPEAPARMVRRGSRRKEEGDAEFFGDYGHARSP